MIVPLMLFAAAACQPGAAPLTDEDVAAIRSLTDSYVQASLAKDADAIAAFYADDAILMPPNEPATVGKDAIRDREASVFELGEETREFTLTPVEIDGVDGLAFDRGTWSWTGIPLGITEPITVTGKYVVIVRRQEDGSWLWTVDIWNSDAPSPCRHCL
jgi:uncharacterized protein (TIGR02246 family)